MVIEYLCKNEFFKKGFGDAQRLSRQGAATGNEVDEIGPLDIGTIAQAGERCVEKVFLGNLLTASC